MQRNNSWMPYALEKAKQASLIGEVPVGAVLVYESEIIARAGNEVLLHPDPTAHAEMLVLRQGSVLLGSPVLNYCDLYVTLEPCAMCAQAIAHARIRRLYFGAYDPKGGGVEHGARVFSQSTCHHRPEVYGGVLEHQCGRVLKDFFLARRKALS